MAWVYYKGESGELLRGRFDRSDTLVGVIECLDSAGTWVGAGRTGSEGAKVISRVRAKALYRRRAGRGGFESA